MSRIFARAVGLESYDGAPTDDDKKDTIVMKGPLSEVFTEALNKVYAKPEGGIDGASMESQANDALMMQALASDFNNPPQGDDSGGQTTVYGVSAASIDNDDFVDISKEFEGDDKLVLIVDGVKPGPNSPDDSIPAERAELLTGALESFVKANGGQVFRSLNEYAASRAKKD